MLESAVIWLVIWGVLALFGAPLLWFATVVGTGGTAVLRKESGKTGKAGAPVAVLVVGGLLSLALFIVSGVNTIIQAVTVFQIATGNA
ncbi:membrane protein [Microbacterium phage Cece]|nr:membrane protein [Microbacterium phage Cece]UVG35313.1 membrane protein [Microbacterium phage Cece]